MRRSLQIADIDQYEKHKGVERTESPSRRGERDGKTREDVKRRERPKEPRKKEERDDDDDVEVIPTGGYYYRLRKKPRENCSCRSALVVPRHASAHDR